MTNCSHITRVVSVLTLQTARVIAMQASTTVSYFFTDQMEVETKREELVREGKLTEKEADQQNEEWEQVSNFCRQNIHFAVMAGPNK
jgi:hypothetical protein